MVSLLKVMWKLKVPPKIKIFVWWLIISRMPTKDQLISRGVTNISTNHIIEFCRIHPETLNHLFFLCQVLKMIWGWILSWLGDGIHLTIEELMDFGSIQEKVKNANVRNKINTIWIATTWSLWLMRNAMIFENVSYSFDVLCSNMLFLYWRWLACSNPLSLSSFYDWYKLPLECRGSRFDLVQFQQKFVLFYQPIVPLDLSIMESP
ncbi:uncharacterized protein LOC131604312 [Vicia villosa]|uniref:uncharacterized protein LOC131604312 n=1 Tax=Vicia villosa TaxID=3911 RepID=UPI00273A75BD|nr:uncharacterized protein LOC131604312 [Vicia villosa]